MDDETRAGWAAAFTARAQAYWTPARTAQLADGKRLLLPPGEAAPLLRALGILHRDASMPPDRVRKYFQIAHLATLLGPALRALHAAAGARPLRFVDAGCGRSYLGLLLAHLGTRPGAVPVRVLGIDRRDDVIASLAQRAAMAGLAAEVRGVAAPITEVDVPAAWAAAFPDDAPGGIDAVVALHACDTATCDAIALGVALGVSLIAVAPCCQAELARGWGALAAAATDGAFAPVWQSPHLRRELGAHVTDVMRVALLRARGYAARAIELTPDEHTRKNTLIVAPRDAALDVAAAQREHAALVAATGGQPLALAARLAVP